MSVAGIAMNSSVISNMMQSSYQRDNAMQRISSGTILPIDDPAGVSISERMRAQISGTGMAQRNITNQISMHQTSQSFGQSISDSLARMRDLAIQANGITSASDREVLEDEFKMLQDDIARITSTDSAQGKFNGIPLFQGGTRSVQTGPDSGQTTDVEFPDLQVTSDVAAGDSTFGNSIDSVNGLQLMDGDALEVLDAAIDINSGSRARSAAYESAAQERLDGLRSYEDNLRSSESSIRDVDVARESTNLAGALIRENIGYALMVQGHNLESSMILSLLAG